MSFQVKHFNELSSPELYAILKLRFDVFVIEQNCIYNELDDIDQHSYHVFLMEGEKCLATSRLIPAGPKHQTATSIGRVCTALEFRRTNLGKELMKFSIEKLESLFPGFPIKIGAQKYLEAFYNSFGFVTITEPYDEDGIMHIDMLRDLRV